jgi:hypothetical protein
MVSFILLQNYLRLCCVCENTPTDHDVQGIAT